MKQKFSKFEGRDPKRDRDGVKAQRRAARRNKFTRRDFEHAAYASKFEESTK